MLRTFTRPPYTISTDPARLDLDVICAYLGRSYWAVGRSRERIALSIAHSVPFGLYLDDAQVGFARVVTDYVTTALLADVFVLEEHRGHGVGTWLVETAVSQPEVQRVRRWTLGTADAHELYRKFGFTEPTGGRLMERYNGESDREQ